MATAVRRFLMNSVERTTFMTALEEKAWRKQRKPYPAGDAPKKAKMRGCSRQDIVIGRGLLFVRQRGLEGYSSHDRHSSGCCRGHLICHSIEAYPV
jgi:hypothetical protein